MATNDVLTMIIVVFEGLCGLGETRVLRKTSRNSELQRLKISAGCDRDG